MRSVYGVFSHPPVGAFSYGEIPDRYMFLGVVTESNSLSVKMVELFSPSETSQSESLCFLLRKTALTCGCGQTLDLVIHVADGCMQMHDKTCCTDFIKVRGLVRVWILINCF